MLIIAQLNNYEGGTNPLLIFIFIGIIILSIIAALLYVAWLIFKAVKFSMVCKNAGLSGEESGLIKSFLKRFQIKSSLFIVLKRSYLDNFVNQIAHHFGNTEISNEDLIYEIQLFNSIREKLNLLHKFTTKNIRSSRALPNGLPLVIRYTDKITKIEQIFASYVEDNNDLFLGIQPPDDEDLSKSLEETKKAQLSISFVREGDAEYHFDSIIYKCLKQTKTVFYIQHSNHITKGHQQKPLELPASVLSHIDDQVLEYNAKIDAINTQTCVFILENQSIILKKEQSILINVVILEKPLALQASIKRLVKRGEILYHHADIKSLAEDKKQLLFQFAFEQDRNNKKEK